MSPQEIGFWAGKRSRGSWMTFSGGGRNDFSKTSQWQMAQAVLRPRSIPPPWLELPAAGGSLRVRGSGGCSNIRRTNKEGLRRGGNGLRIVSGTSSRSRAWSM
jgi:hypothetical protein